jgi:hypothetical protein
MIDYQSETRLLLAQERAGLLASEMQAARQTAHAEPSESTLRTLAVLLARLRPQRARTECDAPVYER